METGAERIVVLDHPLRRAELCLERTGIGDACKNIKGVYDTIATAKIPNVEVTSDPGKILTAVFSDGKEIWTGI